jgi:hypothetical protein
VQGLNWPKTLGDWDGLIRGLDWSAICLTLAKEYHWHPDQVLETPLRRIWPFLFKQQQRRSRPYDHKRVRERVNRNRARRGMPPL